MVKEQTIWNGFEGTILCVIFFVWFCSSRGNLSVILTPD